MDIVGNLREKPAIGIVIVVLALGIAVWRFSGMSSRPNTAEWYYDLQTGELVSFGKDLTPPPVKLDNGHEGVLARVYACRSCRNIGLENIAYLEKWTAELMAYHKRLAEVAHLPQHEQNIGEPPDYLVALPPQPGQEVQWHYSLTREGIQIVRRVREIRDRCGGRENMVQCRP